MRIPQPLYDRLTLAVALTGMAAAVWGYVNEGPGREVLKFGVGLLLLAYFAVLFENFHSRRAINTRGGIVHARAGLLQYLFPYLLMALVGIVFAVVAFSA